jgi:Rod binding domain-containing protein
MAMDSGITISPPIDMQQTARVGLSGGKQAKKTAEEFESFLVFSVLKECEKSVSAAKKSYAEQTQISLFYEKVADALAKKGMGVKEILSKYLERAAKVSGKSVENR